MDLSDPELIVTGLELDSWEASSMTCYTSLAIIARDLMSDQVRHRCVDFIWASQTGVPWFMEKQKGIVFDLRWLMTNCYALLIFIDRPSWKSKESKTAQQWLSQFPKSPPVININHVSLKSFKCFRNCYGAASEHTTLDIKYGFQWCSTGAKVSSAKAISISKCWMEESLGDTFVGTKYDANLHWGNG